MAVLEATEVFEQIWDATQAKAWNEDGSPVWIVNADGSIYLDPKNEWRPKQANKWRTIILEGGSRSSKTFSTIDVIDLSARALKDKRITAWRNTKTDCKKTVLNDALKHFKATGRYKNNQDFNKTESIFTYYATGSTFEIHGTDDEHTVHGLSQDWAWLNEPYDISIEVYRQIAQRTADFIIIDWNPKQAHFIEDLKKDPRTLVLHSTFLDNAFCPPEARIQILSYQPVSMCKIVMNGTLCEIDAKEYNIDNRIEDEATKIANQLRIQLVQKGEKELDVIDEEVLDYYCELVEKLKQVTPAQWRELRRCKQNEYQNSASKYNWCVYGLGIKSEKPHRIFKWDEVSDDFYNSLDVPEYAASDWGVVDPWGILKCKYFDGCLYFHQCNYASENELRQNFKDADWAEINAKEEEGIISWMFAKLGIPYDMNIICDCNRPLKVSALRDAGWEYAIGPAKPKGSIIDGIALLNNFKCYYTKSSRELCFEQENYSRKLDPHGKVLEEPEDKQNHLMDCARYIALWLQAEGIIVKA